jgi:hypothetical protein
MEKVQITPTRPANGQFNHDMISYALGRCIGHLQLEIESILEKADPKDKNRLITKFKLWAEVIDHSNVIDVKMFEIWSQKVKEIFNIEFTYETIS